MLRATVEAVSTGTYAVGVLQFRRIEKSAKSLTSIFWSVKNSYNRLQICSIQKDFVSQLLLSWSVLDPQRHH